uniref:BED-type domain-containing protein n=1 Tax=Cajanus cajan TaxID=3821 RepID=A0A151QSE6_CAJCA|nr:hypothetical protein KK1_045935 [Cajanus cajan]
MESETHEQIIDVGLNEQLSPIIEDIDDSRPTKKPKTTTSKVWDNFTKLGVKDGKEKAKCNHCGNEYVCGGVKIGTSSMLRHLQKCDILKQKQKSAQIGNMIIDQAGKLRSREIDQKHFEDLLSRAIIEHGLSFSFVEYKWIRELFLYLYPGLRIPSRNTAVSNLWRIHDEEKPVVGRAAHQPT